MRITKLSLTNFRSFKETQAIEFAPVTLLFGPNSVGKSSVLMALFYLQQILEKGQCDPQYIEALDSKYVGGFKSLVNGREPSKSITLKIEYDKQGKIGSTYIQTIPQLSESENRNIPLFLEDVASSSNKVALEFRISWSEIQRTAYVERLKVWINDEYVATASCDEGLKNSLIEELNLFHPILLPSDHDEWLESEFEKSLGNLHSSWAHLFNLDEPRIGWERDDYFSDEGLISKLDSELNRVTSYGFTGFAGSLPVLGKKLNTTFNDDSNILIAIVNEALSDVFVAPLDDLLELLKESLCIGPLRTITDRRYEPNPYPQQKDWYTGLAAIDTLPALKAEKLQLIHHWLSAEDKLNLRIGIAFEHIKEVREARSIDSSEEYSSIPQSFEQHMYEIHECIEDISNFYQFSSENEEEFRRRKLDALNNSVGAFVEYSKIQKHHTDHSRVNATLYDVSEQCATSLSEVGVGVSQLLPLVIGAFTIRKGFIACEQPELHVHPRVQVAIGDLLTQSNSKASFLIETHSEHLILRLLKRVRETNEKELPESFKPVEPNDISVVYLENLGDGVKARKLEITEDGDFKDDWPGGFFEERSRELF